MHLTNTISAPPASTKFKVANIGGGESRGDLSRQWISRPSDERFLSLDALYAAVKARSDVTFEERIETRGIEFIAPDPKSLEDTHRMTVGLRGGREVAPTHWSFGQLAGLAGAPAGYLRKLPSQIAADALSYGMRYGRDVETIKLYGRDRLDLRAATGPDYGRIFDHDVVAAVQQIAGKGNGDARWKVPGVMDWRTMIYDPEHPVTKDTTTLYASDRDVFIFLVDDRNPISVGKLPNGDDDLMFRGFYVTNSEVGKSSLKIAAFYLRAICCNRIMWGVEGFQEVSMRHSKYAPARFVEEARPALQSFAEGSSRLLIEGVEKAKAAKIASDKDEALEFLAGRGLSRKRAVEVFESVEQHEGRPIRTAWDVAQGITRVAQTIPHTDDRVEFESVAGKLLDKVSA
ncbi:hypothetical protein Ga0061061_11615 [Chelatococcus sambhunathii]|uniref:DUF932 domain-containing protein n=1 Tax=Chelatococcus sambhunathii TaxID=363953 RepID=A0ABM9U976_9HYPH|nr:DUF932 domain-containing protein [Chelatococcus sambhunathii]CUA90855.1 hypothetical protein Ga0061061_11615 [Chelatococcus sambhunathii]